MGDRIHTLSFYDYSGYDVMLALYHARGSLPLVESADGTSVTFPSTAAIVASSTAGSSGSQNSVTISASNQVAVNGTIAAISSGVVQLYKINKSVFQYNGTDWFGPIISSASVGATPLTSPIPTLALSNSAIAANPTPGTVVGTVSVTTGLANGTIGTGAYVWVFALSGTNSGDFQMVGSSLQVAVNGLSGAFGPFTITATNGAVTGSFTLPVTVTVSAAANAPILAAFFGNISPGGAGSNSDFVNCWNGFVSSTGFTPTMYGIYPYTYTAGNPESTWVSQTTATVSQINALPQIASSTGMALLVGMPINSSSVSIATAAANYASGSMDATINGIFSAMANGGYTKLYIRPAYEMNVPGGGADAFPYSIVTATDATNVNTCFQRIANLAHAFAGATIQTVWNPGQGTANGENIVPYLSYYPGDAYVDVISLDIYGIPQNNTDSIDSQVTVYDVTLSSAMTLAKAHSKPFAICEWGGMNAAFPNSCNTLISAALTPSQISFMCMVNYVTSPTQAWSFPLVSATAAAWKSCWISIST